MTTSDNRRTLKVYLAAPLFTQTERQWNRRLAAAVAAGFPGLDMVLPQDFRMEGRYNDRRSYEGLFRRCLAEIDGSDAVIAVLDGPDADSGTSFEAGYAYARGVPVIGVRTDYRPGQDRGTNLMCSRACSRFVFDMSFREDLAALAADVIRKLRQELTARGKLPAK